PLGSSWPLGSRWPPRACRTFLPFTAAETNRQQDNQRNRRCFHMRAPGPQGRPGGRIATLSLFGDRPLLHDTLTGGRPPGRRVPDPNWGLDDNKRKRWMAKFPRCLYSANARLRFLGRRTPFRCCRGEIATVFENRSETYCREACSAFLVVGDWH